MGVAGERWANISAARRQDQRGLPGGSSLAKLLAETRGDVGWRDIAHMVGCAKSSVQTWIAKFQTDPLDGLLARKKAPGKPSPLQAAAVQAQLHRPVTAEGGVPGRFGDPQLDATERTTAAGGSRAGESKTGNPVRGRPFAWGD